MHLRPYQAEAVEAVVAWWTIHGRHGQNPVVVVPTAGGKTVIFATLIQRFMTEYPGTRILVLAHRRELISQAESKLKAVWPLAPVGVLAASLGRRELAPVTIASRDTIVGVLEAVGAFDLVIVDEAHNIAPGEATRYRRIIDTLADRNSNMHVIGFTATPYRTGQGYVYGDGKDHLFAGVAYEAHIRPLIEQGYLCPVTAHAVAQDAVADTSDVQTTGGDYNLGQLEQVVSDEALVASAVGEWERLAFAQGRRSTVFFCVSVLHAELVSEELHRRGHSVPVVSGKTPAGEREAILSAFDRGELVGVANVGVLTEGWDCPRLDCIAILRPTKSLGLYLQMVGRGLRLHDSKTNTLVLDFGGCIERFGPIDVARPVERRAADDRTKTCPACAEILSIFKRLCPCGHEFQPPPHKLCPACGEENPTSAAKCIACDHVFANHERKAARGGILSGEQQLREVPIEAMSMQAMVSHRTGNPYLKVIYQAGLMEFYYTNLMIGHEGWAGDNAARQWRAMTHAGTPTPETPQEAVRMDADVLRPVESITVDIGSKYKDVVNVKYKKMEVAA